MRGRSRVGFMLGVLAACVVSAQTEEPAMVRGKAQVLRLYGPRTGPPVVVTSGDGGFVHLGPAVAEFLASKGFFVLGVDAKAYLSSLASGSKTISPTDPPLDRVLPSSNRSSASANGSRESRIPLDPARESASLAIQPPRLLRMQFQTQPTQDHFDPALGLLAASAVAHTTTKSSA